MILYITPDWTEPTLLLLFTVSALRKPMTPPPLRGYSFKIRGTRALMHNAIARTLSIVRQNVVPREPSPTPASPVPADKKPPTDEVKPDSTTHAHEVWLHARPLDHLGVWAYFALAIIVAITCLVLCYLIYTCCQKAVIVQKEDDKWTEVKEGEVVVELTELKGKRLKRPVRGRGRAVMDRSEIESGASLTPSVLMHGWKGLTRSRQGDSMNDTDPWKTNLMSKDFLQAADAFSDSPWDGRGHLNGSIQEVINNTNSSESLIYEYYATPSTPAMAYTTDRFHSGGRAASKSPTTASPMALSPDESLRLYYHLPTPIMRTTSRSAASKEKDPAQTESQIDLRPTQPKEQETPTSTQPSSSSVYSPNTARTLTPTPAGSGSSPSTRNIPDKSYHYTLNLDTLKGLSQRTGSSTYVNRAAQTSPTTLSPYTTPGWRSFDASVGKRSSKVEREGKHARDWTRTTSNPFLTHLDTIRADPKLTPVGDVGPISMNSFPIPPSKKSGPIKSRRIVSRI